MSVNDFNYDIIIYLIFLLQENGQPVDQHPKLRQLKADLKLVLKGKENQDAAAAGRLPEIPDGQANPRPAALSVDNLAPGSQLANGEQNPSAAGESIVPLGSDQASAPELTTCGKDLPLTTTAADPPDSHEERPSRSPGVGADRLDRVAAALSCEEDDCQKLANDVASVDPQLALGPVPEEQHETVDPAAPNEGHHLPDPDALPASDPEKVFCCKPCNQVSWIIFSRVSPRVFS
jgi:hypothetical protein